MNNQTMLVVRDVSVSADWYCQNLGLQKGHGGDEYEQLIWHNQIILQLHNSEADDNHEALVSEGQEVGHGVLIWLSVSDFEAVVQKLQENNVTLSKAPFFNPYGKQWEVWFRDPDGYQVVVSGPSEYPVAPIEQ